MIRLLLVLLALLAGMPAARAQAGPEALLLLPQMQLHDPFIVADEASQTYCLFTRNGTAMTGDRRLGSMVYTSKDLTRLVW